MFRLQKIWLFFYILSCKNVKIKQNFTILALRLKSYEHFTFIFLIVFLLHFVTLIKYNGDFFWDNKKNIKTGFATLFSFLIKKGRRKGERITSLSYIYPQK